MRRASGSSVGMSHTSVNRRRVAPLILLLVLLIPGPLLLHFEPHRIHSPHTTKSLLQSLNTDDQSYTLISDRVVYDRYARVYSRTLRFPNGKQFEFDIWGRNWRNDSFAVVCIVPFDKVSHTFTLVREYNVAHMRFVYSFPQGQVEGKHHDLLQAASAELEEEAHMRCDDLKHMLTGNGITLGAPQDKYQRERVFYFMCTKWTQLTTTHRTDPEENIQIVNKVTPDQLYQLVAEGTLQSNNMAAAMLAIHQLKEALIL